MGHGHVVTKDVEAEKKLFLAMGGKLYTPGGQPADRVPGVYIRVTSPAKRRRRHRRIRGRPRRLIVDNVQRRVAEWKAAGVNVLPGSTAEPLEQALVETPDGVRMEILEDKTQTVPIRDEQSTCGAGRRGPESGRRGTRGLRRQGSHAKQRPVVNCRRAAALQHGRHAAGADAPSRAGYFGFDVKDHAAFVKRLEPTASSSTAGRQGIHRQHYDLHHRSLGARIRSCSGCRSVRKPAARTDPLEEEHHGR